MSTKMLLAFWILSALASVGISADLPAKVAPDAHLAGSSAALTSFRQWLDNTESVDAKSLPAAIAQVPLNRSDAEAAAKSLWDSHVKRVHEARAAELKSGVVEIDGKRMPFTYKTFGEKPENGRSLWISMHGGGGAPKAVNDRQWENQKKLYTLQEGIYLVPRAPTDTWNLWHEGHIDTMFARLIEDMVVVEGVDPNKVYIMGYSAGGDGVYQLAPRMADRLAAAAMMAGHPNETQPQGLRNLPFALLMGGDDKAYNRNAIAREWAGKLEKLRENDLGGYTHFVKIFEGKGHWMGGEDKIALPWMAAFRRNLQPDKVIWRQDDIVHDRFYWLGMDRAEARAGQELAVARSGQNFVVQKAQDVNAFRLILDDRSVDLDEPVRVMKDGKPLFEGRIDRTLAALVTSFAERPEPGQVGAARVSVAVVPAKAN
ncbi:alpha/beta hydrolase [bacterium]|nr:alpha/beta hydrolase [bacterium]